MNGPNFVVSSWTEKFSTLWPCPPAGVRWECPVCGVVGTVVSQSRLATTAGRNHMQTHISDDDREALEALKVTRMPESLLTPSQHALRDQIQSAQN